MWHHRITRWANYAVFALLVALPLVAWYVTRDERANRQEILRTAREQSASISMLKQAEQEARKSLASGNHVLARQQLAVAIAKAQETGALPSVKGHDIPLPAERLYIFLEEQHNERHKENALYQSIHNRYLDKNMENARLITKHEFQPQQARPSDK